MRHAIIYPQAIVFLTLPALGNDNEKTITKNQPILLHDIK